MLAPARRASSASARVSAPGSTRLPSWNSHASDTSEVTSGSSSFRPAASSRSARRPARPADAASSRTIAASSSLRATARVPIGSRSKWTGIGESAVTSRYIWSDDLAIGSSTGSQGSPKNPMFRPDAPAASSSRSRSVTLAPERASSYAHAAPMMPPPTMTTSDPAMRVAYRPPPRGLS
jgi:hypothetical protein